MSMDTIARPIRDCPAELEWYCKTCLGERKPEVDHSVDAWTVPEVELDQRLKAARRDKKLVALMKGETGDYPSASEVDAALISKIAFYLGPDPEQIEVLARKSALVRDKWDRKDGTYGTHLQRTIMKELGRRTEYYQPKSSSGQSGRSGQSGTAGQSWTSSGQVLDTSGQSGQRFEGNLTAEIKTFVENSEGCFNVSDIDREFGLTTRADKKRRTEALRYLINKSVITRDRRVSGKYHILTTELDFVDLDCVQESAFPLVLPLDLDHMVTIPPKAIVVLAGSSNSGKTAFLLNVLRCNLNQNYPLLYLMSEMGGQEYKSRLSLFGDPLDQWKRIKAAPKSAGFNAAVAQFNQNGLTVVDFLEEVEGEYHKIASDIRAIYDALGDGVAFIALQKRRDQHIGRGGEATTEKARLYLSLDNLVHRPRCTVAGMRIVKAKSYPGDNPNGLERHFKILRGSQLEPLSKWMYCNDAQREQYIKQYQKMLE